MYALVLALRYLRQRRISLLGVTAVALGVFAFIVVVGVMEGFREELRARLRGALGDVTVLGGLRPGPFQEQVLELLRQDDQVTALTRHLEGVGILRLRGRSGSGAEATAFKLVAIRGIDPLEEAQVTDFTQHLVDLRPGDLVDAAEAGEGVPWLLAGAELIERPRVSPGAEVKLLIPRGLGEYESFSFRLAGTFRTGVYEYDSGQVYIPLAAAQRMRRLPGAVSRVVLKLTDDASPRTTAEQLQKGLNRLTALHPQRRRAPSAVTSDQMHPNLLEAIRLQTRLAAAVLFFYFLVAGVAVFAIMTMVVVEKTRDIGVVRAIGGSVTGVMGAFVFYGLAIGLSGVLVGVGAGRLTLERLDWLRQQVSQWTGWEPFPKEVYLLDVLPWTFSLRLVLVVTVVALGAVLASSLYPAWRGARLQPVETLRYE